MVTTALREKMRAILRARNYSPRTEETYIAAVVHFARHFRKPPDQLGAEHVIAYQVWLRDQIEKLKQIELGLAPPLAG